MEKEARSSLFSPLVLWAAWLRIDHWYGTGNWAPQPELALWRNDPVDKLRTLGQDLRREPWQPEEWLQVPFPKQGGCLRHMLLPTVKDQVASMAYLVLLGPLLDSRLKNFVFGSRWNRPRIWDTRRGKPKWASRPYQFREREAYLPYSRDFNLYRRVAHWSVARMTGDSLEDGENGARTYRPGDFDEATLPEWARKDWWRQHDVQCPRAAWWATLDLQLAFPSVQLDELKANLRSLLKSDFETLSKLTSGYPWPVLQHLKRRGRREALADELVNALGSVRVRSGEGVEAIPVDAWKPLNVLPEFSDPPKGLPTGLAISGMLLNACLSKADAEVFNYLRNDAHDDRRGAFLRFADDMTLLARSPEGLFALIDRVWAAISGNADSCPSDPKSKSNLYFNWSKINPEPISDVVTEYLQFRGWTECDTQVDGRRQLIRPTTAPVAPYGLSEWWRDRSDGSKKVGPIQSKLARAVVKPGAVDPFVGLPGDRLSEIGRDTLADRFGERAHERLGRLHDLARLDIEHEQVRPETRRAFAVNRLVRAWLPGGETDDRAAVVDIRKTVASVLEKTPWKSSLWRAVVRAASMRPSVSRHARDDREAQDWLQAQLRRIACRAAGDCDFDSWIQYWPEASKDLIPLRNDALPACRSLYLSNHRAEFWRQLADTMRLLRRHHLRAKDPRPGDPGPSARRWAVRAVPEGRHEAVADFLAQLDCWATVLYQNPTDECDDPAGLTNRRWELDSLVEAALASLPRSVVAEEVLRCQQSEPDILAAPRSLLLGRAPRVLVILERCGRLREALPHDGVGALKELDLAHVWFGAGDRAVGRVLFPNRSPSAPLEAKLESRFRLAVGDALECASHVSRNLALKWPFQRTEIVKKIRHDPLTLLDYGCWRRLHLGVELPKSAQPTLHRLLWGAASSSPAPESWLIRPWDVPCLGLPVGVSLRLFRSVGSDAKSQVQTTERGPWTWRLSCSDAVLWAGRRMQFGFSEAGLAEARCTPRVVRSADWEVPPHPAYFLPFASAGPLGPVCSDAYEFYCDVLLLLTALDGGERILDQLVTSGVGAVPFEDRWEWRSRIHLPSGAWATVEQVIRWAERPGGPVGASWGDVPERAEDALSHGFRPWTPATIGIHHFACERVDIRLEVRRDEESVREVRLPGAEAASQPDKLRLDADALGDSLVVRIGQVAERPNKSDVVKHFPRIRPHVAREVMQQVERAFQAPGSMGGGDPQLVLLPEVSIPEPEVGSVRELARKTGRACLAGLYWRVARPPYQAHETTEVRWRWIVNEAELVVPLGSEDRGPTSLRWYRVRKSLPADVESGLAGALPRLPGQHAWKILEGRRWYRFLHPQWGDFAVAICADLLDPAPWRSLRGDLLHLFLVAYNKDVNLFESVTWTRAYENFVNLVLVNHGHYGGSVLWTPQRSHGREVARLRGRDLFLLADARLPVRSLFDSQPNQLQQASCAAVEAWQRRDAPEKEAFKSPPPKFRRT